MFEALTQAPAADGSAGDVQWKVEKWLVLPQGKVVARFWPQVDPADPVRP